MTKNQSVYAGQGLNNIGISPLTPSQINAMSSVKIANTSNQFPFNQAEYLKGFNGGITISTGSHYKKYEIIESEEDLLTLSATAYRLQKEDPGNFYKILDDKVFQRVTVLDRDFANEMRDYYSKKIMMWKLKGNKLSEYREELNRLVHNDGKIFKENKIGIAYYLPIFYEYDVDFDSVKNQITLQPFKNSTEITEKKKILSANLQPLKRIIRKTRRVHLIEYWFKDDILDAGVVIKIEKNNKLEHLWNHMFTNEKVLKIKGTYTRRNLDDLEYFSITNWEIDRT